MKVYKWWEAVLVAGMVGAFMAGMPSKPVTAPLTAASGPAPAKPNIIALTFDDGPSPEFTPKILALLNRYHARATFFVLGTEVAHFPKIVRDLVKQGSVVANHGYNHVNYFQLGVQGTARDAGKLATLLKEKAIPTVPYYRPPYGNTNKRLIAYMEKHGYTVTLWSIDTRDWAMPGTSFITRKVLSNAKPGSIVLMHDGGGNRTQTVRALAAILPTLESEGYKFVTLPQYVKDLGLKSAPPKLPLPEPSTTPRSSGSPPSPTPAS